MYCIRKFADCWAVFNWDSETSRPLTAAEADLLRREIPELDDPKCVAYYTDRLDELSEKP